MDQAEIVSLEELIKKDHVYRKVSELFPEAQIKRSLEGLEQAKGADGYGIIRLFNCLFLQFFEDLSDRELARFLQENTAAKWFCGFTLSEKTPTFTLFGKIRSKIGNVAYLNSLGWFGKHFNRKVI